jgi:hypothetical protein
MSNGQIPPHFKGEGTQGMKQDYRIHPPGYSNQDPFTTLEKLAIQDIRAYLAKDHIHSRQAGFPL